MAHVCVSHAMPISQTIVKVAAASARRTATPAERVAAAQLETSDQVRPEAEEAAKQAMAAALEAGASEEEAAQAGDEVNLPFCLIICKDAIVLFANAVLFNVLCCLYTHLPSFLRTHFFLLALFAL